MAASPNTSFTSSTTFRSLLACGLLALAAGAALTSTPASAQVEASSRARPAVDAVAPAIKPTTISTNGTARVYRTPDYLDVSIGVALSATTAGEAQKNASTAMEQSMAAIKALNLEGMELQTGDVRLEPRYDDRPGVPYDMREIIGYVATMSVRVRTEDIKAAAKIIDAGLAAGANRVEYVNFGVHAALEAREEAIRLAAQAAKRKAGVLAESLDLRVTRVESANSNASVYGMWGGRNYSNLLAQNSSSREGAGASEEGDPVAPGKIEIYAEVSVTYEAVQKNQ